MINALPTLFISHGSPMTALEPGPAGAFMQTLGSRWIARFGRPKAILAISAHTLTREPALLAGQQHEAVHDFGGFDPKLFTLRYDAPGAPALAQQVHALLAAHGIPSHVLDQGGLDHGIWTPLRYMLPAADVPVLPLGWSPRSTPRALWDLGSALSPLVHEGVMIMASGSITHNLSLFMAEGILPQDASEAPESLAFRTWMAEASSRQHWDALWDYRHRAPHAVAMHPTDEHLLPWFVAAGAGGADHAALRLYSGAAHRYIGMDGYAFGESAHLLQAA
jgi:4,5-DOPA dioxygenase extradiol